MNIIFIEITQTFPTLFTQTVRLVELMGHSFQACHLQFVSLLALVGLISIGICTYHRDADICLTLDFKHSLSQPALLTPVLEPVMLLL